MSRFMSLATTTVYLSLYLNQRQRRCRIEQTMVSRWSDDMQVVVVFLATDVDSILPYIQRISQTVYVSE